MPEQPLILNTPEIPKTPEEVAEEWRASPRRIRSKAREIRAFALIGNQMRLFPKHIEALAKAFEV